MLAAESDDPDALDGLGQSLWWLGQKQAAMELRAKAFEPGTTHSQSGSAKQTPTGRLGAALSPAEESARLRGHEVG